MMHTYTINGPRRMPQCREAFRMIVDAHHGLQQAVLSLLGEGQDMIHNLTHDGWQHLLSHPNHHLITAHRASDNALVGQVIALLPTREEPDADMLDMKLPSEDPTALATFRTISSHPDHRGHQIMRRMLDHAMDFAAQNNRRHMLGCITRSNAQSWSQFLRVGMFVTSAGHDPSDGSTVYHAHRDNCSPVQLNQQDEILVAPDHPLQDLKKMFECGYVGIKGERDLNRAYTGRLVLAKRLVC